jgi:hypothetical protein
MDDALHQITELPLPRLRRLGVPRRFAGAAAGLRDRWSALEICCMQRMIDGNLG